MGWVCGMTGVGFILSGYLGGLFGWSMSQSAQILLAIGVVFLCVLINIYGVRFATMVNNIGVSLELVITVGATALVAIIAFSAPENHQPISVLFTGGESGDKNSYMLAWLAAALGPFFGLIGVESGADVAEETKNARYVVPKTMFYALVTSIVIELLMYIVYVLAIKDADAVEANAAAPIEEIINQQAGSGRHENRCRRGADEHPGVPAGQHPGRDAADLLDGPRQHAAVLPRVAARLAEDQDAHLRGDRPAAACRRCCCSRRWSTRRRSTTSSASRRWLFFFVYILQTIGLLIGYRRGTIPAAEPGTFDLGRWRLPIYVIALVVFLAVAVALVFLPQFASNKWVFLGVVVLPRRGGPPGCGRGCAAVMPGRTTPRPT